MLEEIYESADEVAICLGEETAEVEKAILLIHEVVALLDRWENRPEVLNGMPAKESGLYKRVSQLERNRGWEILMSLINQVWW